MRLVPKQRSSRSPGVRLRRFGLLGDEGALTLSYVVVIPVFLASIMVIVQACVWYLARETAIAAARQGADIARTAQRPPGSGAAAAVAFARRAAPGFLLAPAATTSGSSAATIRIVVTGRVPSLVPGLVLTVSETVTAPVERFTASGSGRPLAWDVRRG